VYGAQISKNAELNMFSISYEQNHRNVLVIVRVIKYSKQKKTKHSYSTCGEKVKFLVFLVRIFTLRDKISSHLTVSWCTTGAFNFHNLMDFKLKLTNI
jgi:hypothetical protein